VLHTPQASVALTRVPTTSVKIGGCKAVAILDTGASLSLVSADFLSQVDPGCYKELEMHLPPPVTSVSGEPLRMERLISCTLLVKGKPHVYDFYVVNFGSKTWDVLLGFDFMEHHRFDIVRGKLRSRDVSCKADPSPAGAAYALYGETGPPKHGRIDPEGLVIPPHTTAFIEMPLEVGSEPRIFSPSEMLPPDVYAAYSLAESASVTVLLSNLGPESRLLPRGFALGVTALVPRVIALARPDEPNQEKGAGSNSGGARPRVSHEDFTWDHLCESDADSLWTLITEYQDIFASDMSQLGDYKGPPMTLETADSTPVYVRAYRIPQAKRQALEEHVKKLHDAKIITPCQSAYSSPVVMVKKKTGDWRFCVNFKMLNDKLVDNKFPLPNIRELLSSFNKANFYSVLDLNSGFWQLPIVPEDVHKTAFQTPSGHFAHVRVPMGLKTSPSFFQHAMQLALGNLVGKTCSIYLDDICVATSGGFEAHLTALREVMERLRTSDLKLRPSKCKVGHKQVDFLGHRIGRGLIKPQLDKIKAIRDYPTPTSVPDLRSALGLFAYYGSTMVPHFAMLARPLYDLLHKKVTWHWSNDADEAFQGLKDALCSDPVMRMPDFNAPFVLTTDGSVSGIGAVLEQEQSDGLLHPVGFYSRALTKAEQNYAATEIELLAVVTAVTVAFRYYVFGRRFTLRSDCSSLRWLLQAKEPTPRMARWVLKLSDYDFSFEHRPGTKIPHADSLSRFPVNAVRPKKRVGTPLPAAASASTAWPINPGNDPTAQGRAKFASDQAQDNDFGPVIRYLKQKTALPRTTLSLDQFVLRENILYHHAESTRRGEMQGVLQVCLPLAMRADATRFAHSALGSGHYGVKVTIDRVRKRYFWPNMLEGVSAFVLGCESCQLQNVSPAPGRAPFQEYEFPQTRGEMFSIDLVGKLPQTFDGNRYIFVAIDIATKWIEVAALPDMTTETVARAFIREVVCRHGTPRVLRSDRGAQFTSAVFKQAMIFLGIEQSFGIAYHHQDNAVERHNGTLQQILAHYVRNDPQNWDQYLHLTALAMRTAVSTATGESPFFLQYLRDPVLPYDRLFPDTPQFVSDRTTVSELIKRAQTSFLWARHELEENADARRDRQRFRVRSKVFAVGEKVYLRIMRHVGKLQPRYEGPYRIVEQLSDVKFRVIPLTNPRAQPKIVHHDMMRHARDDAPFPRALSPTAARTEVPVPRRTPVSGELDGPSSEDEAEPQPVKSPRAQQSSRAPRPATRSRGPVATQPWTLSAPLKRHRDDLDEDRVDESDGTRTPLLDRTLIDADDLEDALSNPSDVPNLLDRLDDLLQ
jgi:hypothetical protein